MQLIDGPEHEKMEPEAEIVAKNIEIPLTPEKLKEEQQEYVKRPEYDKNGKRIFRRRRRTKK